MSRIFCEPAGAAATAAVLKAARERLIMGDARIVSLVTGSGFKDAASVERMVPTGGCPLVEFDEFARCV